MQDPSRLTVITPPPQYPLARQGAGHAPLRRPGSVRRTTSIDCRWRAGFGEDVEMIGRARDLLTPEDGGAPVTLGTSAFTMTVSTKREILALATEPRHPHEQQLVGVRAGGASREALAATMGDVRGQPLFQLIDDFAGASLVSAWIWSQWDRAWLERMRNQDPSKMVGKRPRMNICAGFVEGSSALDLGKLPTTGDPSRTEVLPLPNPADPEGWHAMPEPGDATASAPTARRTRRIDLWRDGSALRIDAAFQDSGLAPDGARIAIHEYRVYALVDVETMRVRALQALPLILPFSECPAASINASQMVGEPIGAFRQRVIELLPGTIGCTHLNDVLRALADVPDLAAHLAA